MPEANAPSSAGQEIDGWPFPQPLAFTRLLDKLLTRLRDDPPGPIKIRDLYSAVNRFKESSQFYTLSLYIGGGTEDTGQSKPEIDDTIISFGQRKDISKGHAWIVDDMINARNAGQLDLKNAHKVSPYLRTIKWECRNEPWWVMLRWEVLEMSRAEFMKRGRELPGYRKELDKFLHGTWSTRHGWGWM